MRLKPTVPVVICMYIYLCVFTEPHWHLIEAKKGKCLQRNKCESYRKKILIKIIYWISPLPLRSWNLSFSHTTMLKENSCLWWHRPPSPAFCCGQQFMPFSLKWAGTILTIFLFPLGSCCTRVRSPACVLLKVMWHFYKVCLILSGPENAEGKKTSLELDELRTDRWKVINA